MNDVLKNIYERRAVRKYKDIAIDRSIIEQVLDAGRMAPSAINKQPWKFYVLTNKKEIKAFSKEIAEVAKSAFNLVHDWKFNETEDPIFHGAPVVIFITSPKDSVWAALDVGMCTQNMMLAARSLGLASCPVGMAKFVEHAKIFSRLNVPSTEHVNLAVILGYGNENPQAKERIKNNVIFLNEKEMITEEHMF